MAAPKTTVVSGDTTQAIPQTTSAGDAPADTYDPLERVSSVNADKAAAAAAGYLTVNAVEPVGSIPATTLTGNRTEVTTGRDQTGTAVTMVHNYDTGLTVAPKAYAASTAYAKGDYVMPAAVPGKVFECTTAGTSHTAAPAWGTPAVGATLAEGAGTCVWTRRV